MDLRKHSSTSNVVRFVVTSTADGSRLTGLTFNTAGLIISVAADNQVAASFANYTQAAGNIEDITTLGLWATPTASKCRFKQVDATNQPGLYEFQFLDSVFATANAKKLVITISGASADGSYEINLDPVPVNVEEIGESATAASNLRKSADVMVPGTVDNTAFTPTSTEFESDDIVLSVTEALKDRRILWVSGTLIKQVCGIVDYELVSGRGHFTITATTAAPANGDMFIVV